MMNQKVIGLVVAVCALLLFDVAAAQAAMRFCVSITGVKQGQFRAQGTVPYCGKSIEGVAFHYSVVSPRDLATGQATGKRAHKPVRIQKEWGAASPQLFQALAQNEPLTAVVVDFFSTDPTGKTLLDHTIKLTNAFVASIEHHSDSLAVPPQPSLPAMETVEFVFQQIELIDHKSKSGAMDSW
jgi:type VI secretion system secreted protein Hcp